MVSVLSFEILRLFVMSTSPEWLSAWTLICLLYTSKKNLAKEATNQASGELKGKQKSEEKHAAELLAEARRVKEQLEK